MECEPPSEITQLLQDWRDGNGKALDILLPRVYKELRRLARRQVRKERPDHTLQSAALVHEAYLRLVGVSPPQWESRTHFFAIAAQFMRQILVDYARRHGGVLNRFWDLDPEPCCRPRENAMTGEPKARGKVRYAVRVGEASYGTGSGVGAVVRAQPRYLLA
jgi:DNA-directed RNA polymerase specialized sigma24 family protein